ncbi:MAG TPA: hypothetical protein DC049_09505 [Spirochaetia bacterium]|nr:hypothetical protein [Spirochaetia bacterium]
MNKNNMEDINVCNQQKQPNILLITTDQHRLSGIGCYGNTPCQTPWIDSLAERGVRFETAYTTCPVCTPARASIMTGLYPHAHGMSANIGEFGCLVHECVDRPALLSRRLKTAGYRLGYNGKYHLSSHKKILFGLPNKPYEPADIGFDDVGAGTNDLYAKDPGFLNYLADNKIEIKKITEPHRTLPLPQNCTRIENSEEATCSHYLTEHCLKILDSYKNLDQPFFLWHSFDGPHYPYTVPESFYNMYKDVPIPQWKNFNWDGADQNFPYQMALHPFYKSYTWEDWSETIRHYYAYCTLIDRQIGRILAFLEQNNLAENTVVIFTADHGESLGDHGGMKNKGWHHFESTHRIPLILTIPPPYQPQGYIPGSVKNDWASILDIFPTICSLAGAPYRNEDLHGMSLLSLFEKKEIKWRDKIFVEFNGVRNIGANMLTFRHKNIKYGWNAGSRYELYDLEKDPEETINLADDPGYAKILHDMQVMLHDFLIEMKYPGENQFRHTRLDKAE